MSSAGSEGLLTCDVTEKDFGQSVLSKRLFMLVNR